MIRRLWEAASIPAEGGFDDGAEFIVLDQGSPPTVYSEEDEGGDDDESEADESQSPGTSESEEDESDSEAAGIEDPLQAGEYGSSAPPAIPSSSSAMDTDEEEVLGVVA